MKLLLAIALVGVGCKSEAEKICQRAAERYEKCMTEVLGDGVKDLVHDNLGIGTAVCAKSDKTVAMYRECLDKASCDEFDKCMDSYAERTAPKVDPKAPRAVQCQQHVKNSQVGLALEILIGKNDTKDVKAVACLSADDADAKTCLSDDDAAVLAEKSKALETECNGWAADVAACKLKLPDAKCIDGGDEPAPPPPDLGPAGPAIAWSVPLPKDDALFFDRPLQWSADHTLVLVEHKRLHALKDGKELWSQPTTIELANDLAVAGNRIFIGDHDGLHVLDLATGKEVATPLPGFVFAVRAAGEHVLVRLDADIYDVACGPARCTPTKLVHLSEDTTGVTLLASTHDGVVIGSSDEQMLLDRRGKPRLSIKLDESHLNKAILVDDAVAITDDDAIALLSPAACAKRGPTLELASVAAAEDLGAPCVIAYAKGEPHGMIAVPGAGIAYNDDETERHTHLLGKDHTWSTLTYGSTALAADADSIYVIARVDYDGPRQVVALARDTGVPRWHTELPKDADPQQLVARDGYVAACAEATVFVIQVPPVKRRT